MSSHFASFCLKDVKKNLWIFFFFKAKEFMVL